MQRGVGGRGMNWFAGGDLLCVACADAVAGCINVWDQQKAEQKPIKLPVTVQSRFGGRGRGKSGRNDGKGRERYRRRGATIIIGTKNATSHVAIDSGKTQLQLDNNADLMQGKAHQYQHTTPQTHTNTHIHAYPVAAASCYYCSWPKKPRFIIKCCQLSL